MGIKGKSSWGGDGEERRGDGGEERGGGEGRGEEGRGKGGRGREGEGKERCYISTTVYPNYEV